MRRDYWHLDFMCGFDGVELSQETYGMKFNAGISVATTYVDGKVSYPEGGNMLDHFRYLASEVHETAKFCFPTAGMYHFRPGRDGISEEAYPDLDEFWEDIGKAYNDAVMDFIANGATYLQIDDVNFCYLCDREQRERVTARGDDPDGLLDTYIKVNNASIAGRPDNVAVTTHMCRGNFQSSWMARGGYEPVAEKMFNETDVDGFFMEFDSDRAGDFEPLRFVPKGQDGGSRPGDVQVSRTGAQGRTQGPGRRGLQICGYGPALHQPPVRLRQHPPRQQAERIRAGSQIGPLRRSRE